MTHANNTLVLVRSVSFFPQQQTNLSLLAAYQFRNFVFSKSTSQRRQETKQWANFSFYNWSDAVKHCAGKITHKYMNVCLQLSEHFDTFLPSVCHCKVNPQTLRCTSFVREQGRKAEISLLGKIACIMHVRR